MRNAPEGTSEQEREGERKDGWEGKAERERDLDA